MALSNMTIVSDGNLEFVSISFNYLDRSEINVYFDSVPTSTWAWVGDTNQIKFTPKVPNGVTVLIARMTDATDLRHIFSEGAAFTAKTLDEDLRQVLHIVQEAKETNLSGNFYSDIDMNGNKVTNLAPGSNPSDAVTFQQLQDLSPDAGLREELAKDYANTGSGLVGFRQDSIGAIGRSVESKLREIVSIKDFGAVGDGLTDDTAAIQAALDSLVNVYFPDGKYLITSTLISSKRGQGFYGGQGSIGGKADSPDSGYGAILQFAPVDNTQPLWIVRTSQVTFSGLKFRGKESERSKVCIKFQKLENTDDVDGYIYDCEFYHFTEPVYFYARALHADRNVFSSLGQGTAITFDWPDSGGEGGDINIGDLYKGRAHRITNNRFHGSGVAITIKNYTQRSPIYASNMLDTGGSFMRVATGGGLSGAIIVGNTIDLCSATCVTFDALSVCRNTVFSANKIGGAIAGLVDGEDRRPFMAIAFNGVAELDGLLVANNTICATDAAAISIFNDAGSAAITAKNININGNLFDHIGLQGVDRPIFFTAFDIDNFVFSNNTIGAVGAGFIGLIRGSNRTISNPVIRGNSFDAAYPVLFQTNLAGIIDNASCTSGVYAPELVNEVNVAGSSAVSCQYMRVGNTVTVSGSISVTALSTGDTSVGVSLPIASNFASNSDAGGVFVSSPMTSAANIYGGIAADSVTDYVRFRFNAINTDPTSLSFNFTYRIR